MFFVLSKLLGFFAIPSNLVVLIGIVGLFLIPTRFARAGRWLAFVSLVVLAILGLSPVGNALIIPLEHRFPPWDATHGAPDGIVVLGGAIDGLGPGNEVLNEGAGRLTVVPELARRYPNARILFSGGSAALIDGDAEAKFALPLLESLGVARDRITLEDHSRNTVENAAQARRALAACNVSLSHAAGDRCLPQSGLSGGTLSGRLAHTRCRGCATPICDRERRVAANRHGRARMGWTRGILAHWAQLGAFSSGNSRGRLKGVAGCGYRWAQPEDGTLPRVSPGSRRRSDGRLV
jgi:uncharacterized SAM-binding protein YcdF (DUF218 family)